MPRKPKFRPVIRRVKLDPEQAVLTCACYFGYRGTFIFSYKGVGSTSEGCISSTQKFTAAVFSAYELGGDGAYMHLSGYLGTGSS